MIFDIGLNDFHHLKKRLQRIAIISEICDAIPKVTKELSTNLRGFLLELNSRKSQLSSIGKAVLEQKDEEKLQ